MKKVDNRVNHPECRTGEMFTGNVYEWRKDAHIELGQPMDKFSNIVSVGGIMFRAKTFRVGEEAYDFNGDSLPSFRPCFMQISEFEENYLDAAVRATDLLSKGGEIISQHYDRGTTILLNGEKHVIRNAL